MNRRFLCIFAWMGLAAPLFAQDAKTSPLPPGPLLERAPDYSTWTITFQGNPVEEKEALKTGATGESRPKDKEPVTMVSTVIKTGSTILEQNVDAAGQSHQIWHVSGIRIIAGAGISNPIVCPDYGGGDIFSIDFTSSDFAGLNWLSPSTYWGMVKYQGYDCIAFTGTVSPLSVKAQQDEASVIAQEKEMGQAAEPLKVPAIAYVELTTRFPLFVQFGQEKRFYHYSRAPTAPLALPPNIADSAKAYAQRIERLSAPATRAY